MDAIDGSVKVQTVNSPPPSLLVIVLDTNPYAWDLLSPTLPLSKTLAALQIFINAHLAFSHDNRVAIIAAHIDRAAWLYPTPKTARTPAKTTAPTASASKYLPFAAVERELFANTTALLSSTTASSLAASQTTQNYTTHIAGALTLALSYINKTVLSLASTDTNSVQPSSTEPSARVPVNSRILVLSTSGDLAGQYIPLMNLIFGAQHSRVLIDILKLAGDSVLLQQASFTTGGIFVAPASAQDGSPAKKGTPISGPPTPQALLQYLMQAFLPDPHARRHLLPPTSPHVDFRAACFCHRRVVDVGYVCSICLSIFCEDLRKDLGLADDWDAAEGGADGFECLTCGTRLALSRIGAGKAGADLGAGGEKKKDKKKDKNGKKRDKD